MSDPGVDYREAKEAVPVHVKAWADAERALVAWLKKKRGVPSHVLYDATTGEPLDPAHAALAAAVEKAEADSLWCRALVVACGEVVKGASFGDVIASQGTRPTVENR